MQDARRVNGFDRFQDQISTVSCESHYKLSDIVEIYLKPPEEEAFLEIQFPTQLIEVLQRLAMFLSPRHLQFLLWQSFHMLLLHKPTHVRALKGCSCPRLHHLWRHKTRLPSLIGDASVAKAERNKGENSLREKHRGLMTKAEPTCAVTV